MTSGPGICSAGFQSEVVQYTARLKPYSQSIEKARYNTNDGKHPDAIFHHSTVCETVTVGQMGRGFKPKTAPHVM